MEQYTDVDVEVTRRYACMPSSLERALAAFQREGVQFAIARRGRALLGDEMGALCPPSCRNRPLAPSLVGVLASSGCKDCPNDLTPDLCQLWQERSISRYPSVHLSRQRCLLDLDSS